MKVLQTITNYAQGFAQQSARRISEFMAPSVETGQTNGYFKKYNERQDFQRYSTARAIGGRRQRIVFGASDGTFDCRPNGLEIGLDDHERNQAGEFSDQLLQAKAKTLVSVANVAHAVSLLTKARASVSAEGGVGANWGSSADPVDEIDAQIETIAIATGMMPNRISFGLGAWRKFKGNTKVKALLGTAKSQLVTPDLAGGFFLNPSMQILVDEMTTDANDLGQSSASKANLTATDVFIFLEPGNPTNYDPGFMRTFRTGGGGVDKVAQYRDESAASDILYVDWTEDIQVVSTISAKRITVSS